MKTIQNYVRVQSLEEAYELNQKRNNQIIGGMLWLKMGTGSIGTAIDLCNLNLDTIEENEEQFTFGAMVTLRSLEQHESFNAFCNDAMKKAVKDIVGVQFRNTATVGGSIWGRFGFSDVLTVLQTMDTYVELYKGGIIPLKEFATMKYDNDILVRVIVRKTPARFAYQTMRIQKTDFPVIACGVSNLNGRYRAAVGARPGRAVVVEDVKAILDGDITEEKAIAFGEYVAENIRTGSNLRGSAKYRKHLVRVLVMRCVLELGGAQ